MKESLGEANLVVITIVYISMVVAIGMLMIPRMMDTANKRAMCIDLGGTYEGEVCRYGDNKWCRFETCPDSVEGVPLKNGGRTVCYNNKERKLNNLCNQLIIRVLFVKVFLDFFLIWCYYMGK